MPLRIFDFDLTLTQTHTFERFNYDRCGVHDSLLLKRMGRERASADLKSDLDDVLRHHGDDVIAIATFHNNPDFIAGFLEYALCKSISPSPCPIVTDKDFPIRAKRYEVMGEETPIIISYIGVSGPELARHTEGAWRKNPQIRQIRAYLSDTGFYPLSNEAYFFDDDVKNIEASVLCADLSAYLVSREASASFNCRPYFHSSERARWLEAEVRLMEREAEEARIVSHEVATSRSHDGMLRQTFFQQKRLFRQERMREAIVDNLLRSGYVFNRLKADDFELLLNSGRPFLFKAEDQKLYTASLNLITHLPTIAPIAALIDAHYPRMIAKDCLIATLEHLHFMPIVLGVDLKLNHQIEHLIFALKSQHLIYTKGVDLALATVVATLNHKNLIMQDDSGELYWVRPQGALGEVQAVPLCRFLKEHKAFWHTTQEGLEWLTGLGLIHPTILAKENLRATGLVHPSSFPKEDAQERVLADSTRSLWRHSKTREGMIAVTTMRLRGVVEHYDTDDYLKDNPDLFVTVERARETMTRFGVPVAPVAATLDAAFSPVLSFFSEPTRGLSLSREDSLGCGLKVAHPRRFC